MRPRGARAGGVLGHVFTVGGLTAFSRVLGLVREMLQARLIGAGVEQSAFTLAFAIPNMARKLFGEGALTAAFVPVFKGLVAGGEVDAARRLARSVLTTVMMILGSVVALALVGLWAFGTFGELSPRAALTVRLVAILFPYMVFICGAAFGMGVPNALGRFVEGAFMPAMLNVFWIVSLAALCFFPGLTPSTRVTVVCGAILLGEKGALLDPLASIVVGAMLVKVSWDLLNGCFSELTDHSLSDETEQEIEAIIRDTPGVSEPHNLRTRRIGNRIAIEAHIRMDGDTPLRQAHEQASSIERRLRERFGPNTLVTLHMEPVKK